MIVNSLPQPFPSEALGPPLCAGGPGGGPDHAPEKFGLSCAVNPVASVQTASTINTAADRLIVNLPDILSCIAGYRLRHGGVYGSAVPRGVFGKASVDAS